MASYYFGLPDRGEKDKLNFPAFVKIFSYSVTNELIDFAQKQTEIQTEIKDKASLGFQFIFFFSVCTCRNQYMHITEWTIRKIGDVLSLPGTNKDAEGFLHYFRLYRRTTRCYKGNEQHLTD